MRALLFILAGLWVFFTCAGCVPSTGPWHVVGHVDDATVHQAQALIEAAKRVTPDEKKWLTWGGTIWLEPDVRGACPVKPPFVPAGCATPHSIWVQYPHPAGGYDAARGALAHELCHLGLASGGGYFGGPLDLVSEERADACALLVVQSYRSGFEGQVFE